MSVSEADNKSKIHVADDSREQLEALFDVVMLQQTPAAPKKRGINLPASFTQEPSKLEKGHHRKTISEPAYPLQHMRANNAPMGPLPQGWEMARTNDGLIYYIK